MFLKLLRRACSTRRDPKTESYSPRFTGVRVGVLTIEGEESIFNAIQKELAKEGIVTCRFVDPCDFQFSFWTIDSNPGLPIPIRLGVRLILVDTDKNEDRIGDLFTKRQFWEIDIFASFVSKWIVDRLLSRSVQA